MELWLHETTHTTTHTHPGPTPVQTSTGGTLGISKYRAFMSNGATSQNELVASSYDPVAGGSSSSPSQTPEIIDIEEGKKCTRSYFLFFLFWFSVHIPPVHILRVCTDTGTGTSISAPGTSVGSVHQYRYPTLWQIRYDINTGTGQFGNFGTTSIPVPDTSVGSVRYGYGTVGTGTDFHTGTGNFCKFGTTSIPVPGVPVP